MPDENRLKLTFAVTKRDVLRFMRYHHLQAPGIRLWTWSLYAAWILFPCYLWLTTDYGLAPSHPDLWTWRLVMTGITIPMCALTGILFFWIMTWISAQQWTQQASGVLGERTLEVTPAEVTWAWETGQSTQTWAAFLRVVGSRDYILFYQGQNIAQLIPRRVFASPEAADTFLQLVKDWHAAATVSAPASPRDT